ncbi:MAG TPA: DNA polymerase III subunit delta' [Candidatus Binatia bacterium]|jgi:DNA polymerase-3 subunit delta'
MPFSSDIVGHGKQLATLTQALQQDRLHHAYVFHGPEGVGKRTVALSLAKAVHCRELPHDFCGRCVNCVKIENRNHPDVRWVGPLPKKKDIGIEQVRALEKELNYRAFSNGTKIAVIDPAPLMNFPAQNALLKTLEEPPQNSLLILIATSAGGLLPTLLSRCLRLSFAPLPGIAVVDHLVARKGLTPERAGLLAAVSLGSLGAALNPDTEELARDRAAWVDGITALAERDSSEWATFAQELSEDRGQALKFLEWLAGWYRDILIYRTTENVQDLCNVDLIESLKAQAARHTPDQVLFLRGLALTAAARIRRNVNRRMALENLFINIAELH